MEKFLDLFNVSIYDLFRCEVNSANVDGIKKWWAFYNTNLSTYLKLNPEMNKHLSGSIIQKESEGEIYKLFFFE